MALHSLGTEDEEPTSARRKISDPRGSVAGLLPASHQASLERAEIPQGSLTGEIAYLIVHGDAMLDGNAQLNLATFVSTWMDDHAARIYAESYDKNMIDKDEYPQTAAIEEICTKMIAKLWHAPGDTIGTSTIGSSEACMLAGLAMKRRWQHDRRAAGKSTEKPNLIMSAGVQVVWEKFCNYWEVEPRYVPVTLAEPVLTPEGMLEVIDENTIGVVGILGVTYTGSYEPIKELAEALDDLEARTGLDIPLHVDAASGGMVAPFIQPDLVWDFQLTRVHSINTSGHKYGLVYPGLGWVIWRSPEYLPEDLIFHVSYLGGDMPTLALNFSRPGAQVLLQYYLFVRLGMDGYRTVHTLSQKIALMLSGEIAEMAPFELVSKGDELPVFAWRMKEGYTDKWDLQDLSDRLRFHGWQVPAYPMPDDISDIWVMRIVVRLGLLPSTAELLLRDIVEAVAYLESLDGPMPRIGRTGKANRFTY